MKAILKDAVSPAYKHLNGHTFEVSELANSYVGLNIFYDEPNPSRLFLFKEVLIIDLETEYRVRESWKNDDHCFDSTRERAKREIGYLQRYCIANGYEFTITNP